MEAERKVQIGKKKLVIVWQMEKLSYREKVSLVEALGITGFCS